MSGLAIGLLLWALSAAVVVFCLTRAGEIDPGDDLSQLDRMDGIGGPR